MLKQTKIFQGKKVYKGVVEEVNSKPSKTTKSTNRFRIQEEVFDLEDSVADNAKMISLLMTVISRMYGVLETSQKENINPEDRVMIESIFDTFSNTQTNADNMVDSEGLSGVERLLDRQEAIGKILSKTSG